MIAECKKRRLTKGVFKISLKAICKGDLSSKFKEKKKPFDPYAH